MRIVKRYLQKGETADLSEECSSRWTCGSFSKWLCFNFRRAFFWTHKYHAASKSVFNSEFIVMFWVVNRTTLELKHGKHLDQRRQDSKHHWIHDSRRWGLRLQQGFCLVDFLGLGCLGRCSRDWLNFAILYNSGVAFCNIFPVESRLDSNIKQQWGRGPGRLSWSI